MQMYWCMGLIILQVACKIVHVTSGGEVVDHVKMIAEHFDSTGSPIMIGNNYMLYPPS